MNRLRHKLITSVDCTKIECTTSLIILDWDDTLFFTSSFKQEHFKTDESLLENFRHDLESFLTACLNLCRVIIISNGSLEWIQRGLHFLRVSKHLTERIEIVSARDNYERIYPNNPLEWKCKAFIRLKENSRQIANLICIGDQETEMFAITELAKQYYTSYTKTIKFVTGPSASDLQKQFRLLTPRLPKIYGSVRNLKISFKEKISSTANS